MSKPGPNYPAWYAKAQKSSKKPKGNYGDLPTDEEFGRAGNPDYGKKADPSTWPKAPEEQVGPPPDETRESSNGVIGYGKNMGSLAWDMPGFSINPYTFESIAETGLADGYQSALPGSGDALVGPKNEAISVTPEQLGQNGQEIAPDSADPSVVGENPTAEAPINWMERGPSMDQARRNAVLNSKSPMEMRRALNEAMGMEDELDENKRMTGRTYLNDPSGEKTLFSDTAEGSKLARDNYLDNPQGFLNGVMAGDIVLGGQNGDQLESQSAFTLGAIETPADLTSGVGTAGETPSVDLKSLEIPADVVERAKQTQYVPGTPLDEQNPEYAAARDKYLNAFFNQ